MHARLRNGAGCWVRGRKTIVMKRTSIQPANDDDDDDDVDNDDDDEEEDDDTEYTYRMQNERIGNRRC